MPDNAYSRHSTPRSSIDFANSCHSVGTIRASKHFALAHNLTDRIRTTRDPNLTSVDVHPHLGKPLIPVHGVIISSDHYINDNGPGLKIFTSGTSASFKNASSAADS
ncbi:hypothetical protein BDW59DRAFT_160435 [Aspergillus cavernicola]|uniref:Uncharacterized protein n=1 Tax=Aspergillus cavernicola TaxID=176166 RepID=A0ABR4IHA8_9EURO